MLLQNTGRVFDVVIDGQLCEVHRRRETHSLGRNNGCPDDWWVKLPDGSWQPWIDRGTNRPCFEISLVQGNRTKHKWGDVQISGTCRVTIKCNLRPVYTFLCRDLEYGLAKAQTLTTLMVEHPFQFADPQSELGRKVWYYHQPAVISDLCLDEGLITLEKEGEGGFNLVHPWDKEDDLSEWHGEHVIADDVFSSHIWWFR